MSPCLDLGCEAGGLWDVLKAVLLSSSLELWRRNLIEIQGLLVHGHDLCRSPKVQRFVKAEHFAHYLFPKSYSALNEF